MKLTSEDEQKQRSLPLDLAALIGATLLTILALVYVLGSWQTGKWWPPFTPGSAIDWEPTIRVAIPATALLGAVAAGVIAWHGQLTREQELRTKRDADLVDRYSKAVDQLAGRGESVRLGGLYALERLLHDSPRDAGPIREVLAAHARMWFAALDRSSLAGRKHIALAEEVRTCFTILARTRSEAFATFNLEAIDASRVDMKGVDLAGANLAGANLTRAMLVDANLDGADLSRATADGVILYKASLRGARLDAAEMRDAVLNSADLTGAHLSHTVASGARLHRATLEGATIKRADFRRADMRSVNLRGAQLNRPRFSHACCSKACMSGATVINADFFRANFQKADMTGTVIRANTNLTETDFTSADFLPPGTSDPSAAEAALKQMIAELTRVNRSWRRATWTGTIIEDHWQQEWRTATPDADPPPA